MGKGGGGYHILLVNFLCEGAPIIKSNEEGEGGK